MFGAALTLVTWRQKKILRRLRLAPVSTTTIVGARVGVSIAIALVQMAIFIGVALIPYFGLQAVRLLVDGDPAGHRGDARVPRRSGCSPGSFAKTPEAASAIANLIVLPMAFLSGAFFPLEGAPGLAADHLARRCRCATWSTGCSP